MELFIFARINLHLLNYTLNKAIMSNSLQSSHSYQLSIRHLTRIFYQRTRRQILSKNTSVPFMREQSMQTLYLGRPMWKIVTVIVGLQLCQSVSFAGDSLNFSDSNFIL